MTTDEIAAKERRKLQRQRLAKTQGLLSKNTDLNAEFDSALKTAASPKKKVILKRPRGWPRAGRIIFHQKRIDSLPEFAHLSAVAQILGIKHTTIQQWCALKKHPLPFVCVDGENNPVPKHEGRKMFRKDVLVKWLVSTKRFSIKPEYAEK